VSAARTVGRLVGRYKLAVAIGAAFIVAIVAISVTASNSSSASTSHQDPVAPNFTVAVLGNSAKKISLSQYAGKPLIVNFWASWCTPCQKETPLLARWYKQQDGKVKLIGLDENDTTANALKFVRAKGVTYPIGFDPLVQVADAYSVEGAGIPQTFFLNAQHRIVDHVYGAVTTADLTKGVRLMNKPA
jgi:cytochrome c biogenesis protein CcmG, thiol:disulfide interchange protein DsbE